jgi:phosphoglycolate phosphatase-like HAD superfamily hydrolase
LDANAFTILPYKALYFSIFSHKMNNSIIYALDFDGVICDSALETAITGWKAASRIWSDMPKAAPSDLIVQFRLIRPLIETGYEALLAMRLLFLKESVAAIYADYDNKKEALLTEAKVTTTELKKLFGETRDNWIENDLTDWINKNPLFTDVASKLQSVGDQSTWYVVTTKQERFVKQILKANAIELPDERIFGLDRHMNKIEVLQTLLKKHPEQRIYFVEDRLPTLINVLKTPDLASIKLIFALWGFNTAEDKALAAQHSITLQTLTNFLEL